MSGRRGKDTGAASKGVLTSHLGNMSMKIDYSGQCNNRALLQTPVPRYNATLKGKMGQFKQTAKKGPFRGHREHTEPLWSPGAAFGR